MKVVFGLGNPESEYADTRHNIGKEVVNQLSCVLESSHNKSGFNIKRKVLGLFGRRECVDWRLQQKLNAEIFKPSNSVMLVKPLRYMNDAGVVLRDVLNFFKVDPENVAVIYDDLDLVVGEYRMKRGSATKVHNGIGSILDAIGKESFKKIMYIKVGVREKKIPMSVKKFGISPNKYVLGRFNKGDKDVVLETMKGSIIPALLSWLSK